LRIRRLLLSAGICYAIATLILAVGLGKLAFHPARVPLTARTPAEAIAARFGTVLQDASVIASDGTQLQAWFVRPVKPNGDAVILIHGIGDNRQGMVGFAELFLSKGYAVLLPDSRANGMSGGTFPTYGLEEANDVRDWFNWLEARQHPNCVFGMGESMGAAIVLQAVKTTPFCAVVAESAFASFRQISYIRVGQIFHSGEWLGQYALRPAVELAFVYARLTRGVNLTAASPEQSVVGSKIPILLIHGLADDNIPPRQSEMIRAHNPAYVTLWEVPNAGHCGAASVASDEFDSRVLGWFSGHS
jgi:dipeptidyl aminopeptidase/acylaminoacyl peptidase